MKIVGWRTITAAALKFLLGVAASQGWIPEVDESDFVEAVDKLLDAAIWIFLALKGNRILEKL